MRSTRSARVRSGLGEHAAGEACLREALAIALDLRLPDDVGRAYINLSDAVDQAGRIDEAAELALEGARGRPAARDSARGYRAMLLTEAAQRRFRTGRWDDAERSGRPVRSRCGRAGSWTGSHTRPSPTSRSRAAIPPPRRRASRARATIVPGRLVRDVARAASAAGAAELELSAGRAAAARDVVTDALARIEGQEFPFYTARLHWVGLRVEAELAEEARARFDEAARAGGAGPGGATWPRADRRAGRRDVARARPRPSCCSTPSCARPS